ncbi:single-stranded DNA-binding protein [Leifsonia sp. H3M29-4]|uniref:single-stranded DNA-binding protein n=1 Tax=Salinibacterium metalliresistens TaxID=3031321 RepID=UPI0023DA5408|nr:single-stranded DNA-binding protein [Salinibacterium metalliresistens]MDF1478591.1 single-stranded DNA-binding protein [Salinibacterium metalliresistens]
MSDTITLTGIVATEPRHLVTKEGLPITSFRLASAQRRFDRAQERWIDADTNWYTITTFRQLAINAAGSLLKGERVIVTGRLRIREWESGERTGVNVDIEADAIGHDLLWGTSKFTRSIASTAKAADAAAEAATGQTESQPSEATESAVASERSAPYDEPVAALPY